jgi:hypothetical protein
MAQGLFSMEALDESCRFRVAEGNYHTGRGRP